MCNNYDIALSNAERGIVSIPIVPGKKGIPLVKWKRWQTEMPSEALFREWFLNRRTNIAIITTGMVVFDCEEIAKAKLVLDACGDTPHQLKTPRGVHLGYRRRKGVAVCNQVRIRGEPIDIRTDGGLEMIPNSETEHGRYEWIGDGIHPLSQLPVARIGWTRERHRQLMGSIVACDPDVMTQRARAYLACVEGAINGQRGHDRTFRVACKLTHPPPRGFGLTIMQAWPLILLWNEQCEPPWTERELLHKLQDALKKSTSCV